MAQKEIKCPKCGARVSVEPHQTEATCSNCGTRIDVLTGLELTEITEAGGEEQTRA